MCVTVAISLSIAVIHHVLVVHMCMATKALSCPLVFLYCTRPNVSLHTRAEPLPEQKSMHVYPEDDYVPKCTSTFCYVSSKFVHVVVEGEPEEEARL